MFVIYVIKSVSCRYVYTGMTADVSKRLQQHNRRQCQSTKPYAPFELIYSESAESRVVARRREKYLKSTAGKNYLKNKIGLEW